MATDKLIIKIQAQTDQAEKEIKQLTGDVKKLTEQNKKFGSSSNDIAKVNKGFGSLKATLVGVATSMVALGAVTKGLEFAKLAADAEQAGDAFERVFTDMGLVAEEEFEKIKKASSGLIPDAAIRQSAVTAASLGVPIDKLAQLMEIARVKAREMGTDAQSAFNDLAVGIGRGSPMILDNLGLTIKLEEANIKYAESINKDVKELTKQEKQLALTNAVIEAGADSVERYSGVALSAKENMQKMNAQIEDLKVKIGTALLPLLSDLVENTTKWIESLKDEDIQSFGNAIGTLINGLLGLAKVLYFLNDIILPDWLFGKDVGLVDKFATDLLNLGNVLSGTGLKMKELEETKLDEKISTDVDRAAESLKKLGNEADKTKAEIEDKPVEIEIETDTEKWAKEYNKSLAALQKTPIKVDADTTPAETKIENVQVKAQIPTQNVHTISPDTKAIDAAIDRIKLPTSSTHTIYERVVAARSDGGFVPQRLAVGGTFRGSGKVAGYDPTDSDKVNALLTGGEFVVKRKAVDAYGVGILNSINNMSLPRYAEGGSVGGSASSGNIRPINLNIGGNTFGLMGDKEVAEALQRYIYSEGGL